MNIGEVKQNLGLKVRYKGAEYIFTGYTLRFDKKENRYYHQAELQDLKAVMSLRIVELEYVEVIK